MPTNVSLYNGEVTLTFDEAAHTYMANGEPCPSLDDLAEVDELVSGLWGARDRRAA